MADLRKFQIVKDMVEQGRITIRPELRHANFLRGYGPSADASENYYAVYGSAADIQELESKDCIVSTNRPRKSLGDGQSKAYLGNLEGGPVATLCSEEPCAPQDFALHKAGAPVHAIGLYHTGYPIDGSADDSLSYLVMSAANRREFKTAVERLTNAEEPRHIQMQHIGRDSGEFLLLPIRHSMAEAIKRAHPNAIEITGDASTRQPFSIASMQHIIAQLHDDARFALPATMAASIPKAATVAAAPVAQEPVTPRPLQEWLDELTPYVVGFERHEQIGGGASTRVMLRMDNRLQELRNSINSDTLCLGRNGVHLQALSGNAGSQVTVAINSQTYETMRGHWPDLPVVQRVQELQPSLLKFTPVQIRSDTRNKLSITDLRLTRTEESGEVQNWLVVTAPHMKRAEMLAANLGFGADRLRPITHGSEQPAILLLPVTPSVTESLIVGRKQPVPHDETPYASFDEMQSYLREHVGERTLLTDLAAAEPLRKGLVLDPVPPAQPRAEADIRNDAANVLFSQLSTSQRLWMHYARHQPGKRGNGAQEVVCLGIRMQSERTKDIENKAKEFEKDLRATGFTDLPGREFRYVGSTGEGSNKHHLYRLKLKPQDVEAWQGKWHGDAHWPALKEGRAKRHLVTLTEDQVRQRFERFLQNSDAREKPEETAWRRLASLANEGAIRCVQVRFSADDIEQIGHTYEQQLEVVKGVAGGAATLGMLHQGWKEQGLPVHLHPVDDQVRRLDDQVLHAKNSLNALRSTVESIVEGRESYYAWLKQHPRNKDGSVTLQYLVAPDPRSSTLHHLRQVDQFATAQGHDPLLPQRSYIDERVLDAGRQLHVVPVNPAFIRQLNEHHGHLESTSPEPVMLSGLGAHLRKAYGKPAEEKTSYDHEASINEMDRARENAARKRLGEKHFMNCRNYMLYGQLRPDNNMENLGKRPQHDRIGTQHGLLMHLDSKSQWTQHVRPMLEDMQRSSMLAARKDYVMPFGAIDPATIKARIDVCEASRTSLSDIGYAAQQMIDQPASEFTQRQWRSMVESFLRDAEDLPQDLHAMATELAELHKKSNPNEAVLLVQRTLRRLDQTSRTLRNEHLDAEDAYAAATEEAQRNGMMRQASEPLFYLQDGTSYTLAELDSLVFKNFTGGLSEPLNFMTYLTHNERPRNEYGDESMIRLLKGTPPDARPGSGEWTHRITRRRVECPTNVTFDEFFERAAGIFEGKSASR